jgi:hypothetical protein
MQLPPQRQPDGVFHVPRIVPAEQLAGDDEEDTVLLRQMLENARRYALSFSWCDSVNSEYFGGGIGKIIAVFLFNISTKPPDVDPWMWIIVGDIPSAYLPLEDCNSPMKVFETYTDGLQKWANFARDSKTGTAEEGIPPVNVPATPEWADQIQKRIQLLNDLARPYFE